MHVSVKKKIYYSHSTESPSHRITVLMCRLLPIAMIEVASQKRNGARMDLKQSEAPLLALCQDAGPRIMSMLYPFYPEH